MAVIVGLGAPTDAKAVVAEEVGLQSGGAVHAREPECDCFSIGKAH